MGSIRAAFFHANLDALDALGAAVAERVRKRIPSGVLAEVAAASRVAWVPVEHDILLTEAIEAEVGRARTREWARDGLLRTGETPLLAPILVSARAVFGMTPHGLLRRAPQGWSLLYRDCGQCVYEQTSEREAKVVIAHAPGTLLASAAYLEGIAGGLEAAIVIMKEAGRVTLERPAGRLLSEPTFSCRW